MNHFEQKYYETPLVDPRVRSYERMLVLDDVLTEGSTVLCAVRKARENSVEAKIVVATAGQMIGKQVVGDEGGIVRH